MPACSDGDVEHVLTREWHVKPRISMYTLFHWWHEPGSHEVHVHVDEHEVREHEVDEHKSNRHELILLPILAGLLIFVHFTSKILDDTS